MPLLTKYEIKLADSPFWTFAIHDGHDIDEKLLPYQLLNEEERLREEDPFTALIAELPCNRFIMESSRFQLDINRTLEDAIYLKPEQAWGLNVWKDDFPLALISELRNDHREIFEIIESKIQDTIAQFGYFIILDIHSYNAKREGPDQEINIDTDPEINFGTIHLNKKWRPLMDELINFISAEELNGQAIDVREIVKFKGGYFAQTMNQLYGDYGFVLAIEFRKDFMDEWTGDPDYHKIMACKQLLLKSLTVFNQYFHQDGKE